MSAFSRYRLPLLFMASVLIGVGMTLHQYLVNEHRHVVKREDFLLLEERGYTKKAESYYQRLLQETERLPDHALVGDLERTALLVDPSVKQPDSLVWKYHWAVRKKLEHRAQERLRHVLATEGDTDAR